MKNPEPKPIGTSSDRALNIVPAEVKATTESIDAAVGAVVPVNGQVIPLMKTVDDVFNRVQVAKGKIGTIAFKRSLTKPLISMAHTRELLLKVTEELYAYSLPLKGRKEEDAPATILEGVNMETGEEVMLVCSTMMVSALTRAGVPHKGRYFAFRDGTIKADKSYRTVDVVEVDVTELPNG